LELATAQQELSTLLRLAEGRAAAQVEVRKAISQVRELKERLDKARLPVEEGRSEVSRRALKLVEKDNDMKREEQEIKRGLKLGELAAARLELASLELERKQTLIQA